MPSTPLITRLPSIVPLTAAVTPVSMVTAPSAAPPAEPTSTDESSSTAMVLVARVKPSVTAFAIRPPSCMMLPSRASRNPAITVATAVMFSAPAPPTCRDALSASTSPEAVRLAPPSRSRSANAPSTTVPATPIEPQSNTSSLIASCAAAPFPMMLAKLPLPPVMTTLLAMVGAEAAVVPVVMSDQSDAVLQDPPYGFAQAYVSAVTPASRRAACRAGVSSPACQ